MNLQKNRYLFLYISLLSIFLSCHKSNSPNDLQTGGFKGKVKKVTETRTMLNDPEVRPMKSVMYYNEKGYLTKIEQYNYWISDDSAIINYTAFYNNNDKERGYYALDKNSDTVETGEGKRVTDSSYRFLTKLKDHHSSDLLYVFDSNNKLLKQHNKITYKEQLIADNELTYEYNSTGALIKLLSTKLPGGEMKTVFFTDILYDKEQNQLSWYLAEDDTGNKIFHVTRRIDYY